MWLVKGSYEWDKPPGTYQRWFLADDDTNQGSCESTTGIYLTKMGR